ncbi:MAG: HNH endonuclease signature motif containing protein [Nostoc sp. DedSLP03]|uniref:HNH endonuclease n=1 Tax=Nostoc sp. DedSLP03 TaxID=3075400 RepID=UPI002AD516BF|nr:HNH endonuclease signature motif containing protein [Nostoc sp. DedSLP03]MDZ7964531.1 HNH endonuclease signature motif containing protein [Nostoc sp. DedSLP03]
MNPYYTAIAGRANHRCEYCQAPEVVFNFPFEVEHIIPISRQGANNKANLALACRSCNLRKGTRINGTLPDSNTEVRLFHPKENQWSEHFQVDVESGKIRGMTPVGEVTVEYLTMNSPAQVAARQLWIRLGLFP